MGESKSLECHSKGIPTPTLVWKKRSRGDTLFVPLTNSDSLKINKNVLHLLNMTEQDYGEYKCVAKNERGMANEIVNVRGKENLE